MPSTAIVQPDASHVPLVFLEGAISAAILDPQPPLFPVFQFMLLPPTLLLLFSFIVCG